MKNTWGIGGFKKRDKGSLSWKWLGALVWFKPFDVGPVLGLVVEANHDTEMLTVEADRQSGFRLIRAIVHPRAVWLQCEIDAIQAIRQLRENGGLR